MEAVIAFVSGNDVFVCLPTGYERSGYIIDKQTLSSLSIGISRFHTVCPSNNRPFRTPLFLTAAFPFLLTLLVPELMSLSHKRQFSILRTPSHTLT